jgi:hypothetical protein
MLSHRLQHGSCSVAKRFTGEFQQDAQLEVTAENQVELEGVADAGIKATRTDTVL